MNPKIELTGNAMVEACHGEVPTASDPIVFQGKQIVEGERGAYEVTGTLEALIKNRFASVQIKPITLRITVEQLG